MRIHKIVVGDMQANCYLLIAEKSHKVVVVDPGGDYQKIASAIKKFKAEPVLVINTHGHIDHIRCDDDFGVPVMAHEKDIELLTNPDKNLSGFLSAPFFVRAKIRPLKDAQKIKQDDIELQVFYTPGHTPGGICLACAGCVLTGDTLFAGSIGRTDFPGASHELLIKSIKEKLLVLADETVIYPGHGEPSTIGQERKHNPFLQADK